MTLLVLVLASCLQSPSNGSRKSSSKTGATFYSNVAEGNGLVMLENPIILTGNKKYGDSYGYASLLTEQKITDSQFLIAPCTGDGFGTGDVSSCFNVIEKALTDPITYKNKRWGYGPSTNEWPQIQTFYHLKKQTTTFSTTLKNVYDRAWHQTQTSIPFTLYTSGANWNKNQTLTAHAQNGVENSAFYSPSAFTVNFGPIEDHPTVLMVQDPGVIYHEMAHAYTSIMMNMRNSSRIDRSELGYLLYDEGGAINEGLSDFFSFYMNRRTHFAEWALGRFLPMDYSRPITESDTMHMPGIAKTDDARLSYPTYVIYDPSAHTQVYEEIHNAGMIASHLLVALTEKLQSQCLMTQTQALDATYSYVAQTLAELGDLTATGYDGYTDRVNLNATSSLDWIKVNNPINYRNFAQGLAKYLYINFGTSGCFPKDDVEKFFDTYGLLLFRTYNENGNNKTSGHSGTNATVNQNNRLRSTFINKDQIILDPTSGAAQAYIFDNQSAIKTAIASLQASGIIGQLSTQLPSDLSYNNGNSQVSPGEVVGLALNLYNNSNSPMAGIQVLANDWDHFNIETHPRPCNNLGDSFPLESEGGAVDGDSSCNYVTRYNGAMKDADVTVDKNESIMPVCFIQQIATGGASKWVAQRELVSALPDPSMCLGGSDKPDECFIRAIKGADTSYYSYIAPQSTWIKSLTNGTTLPTFTYSNLIFFEVNSRTPPGTTFNCRFRVRFSNCDDCYHDSSNSNDNYLDYEFSGAKPFKIINLKFSVVE